MSNMKERKSDRVNGAIQQNDDDDDYDVFCC